MSLCQRITQQVMDLSHAGNLGSVPKTHAHQEKAQSVVQKN